MNKTAALPAVLFFVALLTACSPQEKFQSSWQSIPVHVDGDPSEWELPLKLYDESTQLNYTLSNDEQNLYLCIRAASERTKQQIIRGGMQFWIDTTGKKNQQTGIRYPVLAFQRHSERNSSESTSGTDSEQNASQDSRSFHERFLSKEREMTVTGFLSPVSNGLIPIQNIYGIKVSLNWDSSGVMVYEASLPLKLFCESPFSLLKKNKKRTFSFSITTNVVPRERRNGSSGREQQSSGGNDESESGYAGAGMRGGGMRGSGMHGGGRRGGGGRGFENNDGTNESKTFWMQFQLAVKPQIL